MSASRHPVALKLEGIVGGKTRLLATVMGLSLVDGIFPALVLAGALSGPVGILQVGLLVFGGSATVAVILAEMDGTHREIVTSVAIVGIGIVALAAVEAAIAPTIESVLDTETFKRAAALVIAAVAAKTASARVGEYLPRPAVVVGLGLLVSLDLSNPQLALAPDVVLIAKATAAAAVGATFALLVAIAGPHLRQRMDVDRFRFGSAVALGLLALSIAGLLEVNSAPLAVMLVSAVLALDPSAGEEQPVDAASEHADCAD
ncbi:DUF5794 domain-containing protein [Haloarchaeobius amylolyticus]|uniref:DUF5794 domain-containing protein n=1 Tax=Haloarchaeobius amylolyticus TaxID=1198296 RepID=UPI00226EC6C9|nr:DUF5794 domain-containing protein [Haloarchaeobius amylolyticus]